MVMGWIADRRHRALLEQPFPAAWEKILGADVAFYPLLTGEEQARLRDNLTILIAEKSWEPCGGQEITDEIKVCVSAQASLLTLCRDHDYYANVESILIYPAGYRPRVPERDGSGVLTQGFCERLGEAWSNGPVILSWYDAKLGAANAEDGQNVVFHEFAHKLDMNDGEANGVPLLDDDEQVERWAQIMHDEYEALVHASEHGRASLLDSYGATNPAEFFAVGTECFFEKPVQMHSKHPAMYGLLDSYYHQDPAARVQAAR